MPAFAAPSALPGGMPPQALSAGQSIGHYLILSLLGRGGMGEVYLAHDPRLGRKVALKLLPEEFTKDGERVRRFTQEARAASALSHPLIATIYEISEAEGIHYIVMEYVEGQTLRQRMSQRPMTDTEALEIATLIASALSAAHEAGVVDRDVKPENVMLRRDGYVKVLDFGLAKLTATEVIDPHAATTLVVSTVPGMVMGTPLHVAGAGARAGSRRAHRHLGFGVMLYPK